MDRRIGTCGECGGPVVVSEYSDNSTPHCQRCGAIPKSAALPVIPMQPRMPRPAHLTWIEDESDLEPGLRGRGRTSLDW